MQSRRCDLPYFSTRRFGLIARTRCRNFVDAEREEFSQEFRRGHLHFNMFTGDKTKNLVLAQFMFCLGQYCMQEL